jgi:hypothetical protein
MRKRDFERDSAVAGFDAKVDGPACVSSAVVFAFEALEPLLLQTGGKGIPT